jgi:hypothetical protein
MKNGNQAKPISIVPSELRDREEIVPSVDGKAQLNLSLGTHPLQAPDEIILRDAGGHPRMRLA